MFMRALASTPGEAIRPVNLKWELPIAAATGLLIVTSDVESDCPLLSAQSLAQVGGLGVGDWCQPGALEGRSILLRTFW
jgi:hypothetical protein